MHCKETFAGEGGSIRQKIVEELRVGGKKKVGLEGVRFVGVRRGMRIGEFEFPFVLYLLAGLSESKTLS